LKHLTEAIHEQQIKLKFWKHMHAYSSSLLPSQMRNGNPPTHSLFLTGWPSSLTWTGLENTRHILPWDARVLHQRDYVPKTHFCVFFFAPLHLGVNEEGNSRSTWKQQYGCGELRLGTNSWTLQFRASVVRKM
jgi:hypothetical protein